MLFKISIRGSLYEGLFIQLFIYETSNIVNIMASVRFTYIDTHSLPEIMHKNRFHNIEIICALGHHSFPARKLP